MKQASQVQTMKRVEVEQVENGFIVTINQWNKYPEEFRNMPMPCSSNDYKRFVCADTDEVKELLAEKL